MLNPYHSLSHKSIAQVDSVDIKDTVKKNSLETTNIESKHKVVKSSLISNGTNNL